MRNIKSYIKKKISDKFSKNVFLKPKWLGQSLTFSTDKLKKEKTKKKKKALVITQVIAQALTKRKNIRKANIASHRPLGKLKWLTI